MMQWGQHSRMWRAVAGLSSAIQLTLWQEPFRDFSWRRNPEVWDLRTPQGIGERGRQLGRSRHAKIKCSLRSESSYGVGIVNLILSINITCRYRHSKFLPSDDSCQHRTWERVQAARENESSGNAWENRTRWRGIWRQEPVSPRISGTLEAIDVTPSRIVFLLMLSMLVGMKDSSVKLLINDLAACQDKKILLLSTDMEFVKKSTHPDFQAKSFHRKSA